MEQLNFPVVTTNTPNGSSTLDDPLVVSWGSSALAPAVLLSFCFLLGVPANLAVVVFLQKNRQQLSSLSHCLMLNLAVSDLLCLVPLPIWIYTLLYGWTLGLVACKVLAYVVYCSIYGSLLTVTVLSIQRYIQVVHVQRRLGQIGQKRMLLLLWVVVMILASPTLVVRQLIEVDHSLACQPVYSSNAQQVAVLLTESLLGFVLPFSAVASAYICLHRKVNQTSFFNNPRMTRLISSIIITLFTLWMPYHLINILGVAAILLKNTSLLKFCSMSWNIVGALTFVNSCLDPVLYAFASRNICSACSA